MRIVQQWERQEDYLHGHLDVHHLVMGAPALFASDGIIKLWQAWGRELSGNFRQ